MKTSQNQLTSFTATFFCYS